MKRCCDTAAARLQRNTLVATSEKYLLEHPGALYVMTVTRQSNVGRVHTHVTKHGPPPRQTNSVATR